MNWNQLFDDLKTDMVTNANPPLSPEQITGVEAFITILAKRIDEHIKRGQVEVSPGNFENVQ